MWSTLGREAISLRYFHPGHDSSIVPGYLEYPMKNYLLLTLLLLCLTAASVGQTLSRVEVQFPSISSQTSVPFLVANVPPNSPVLAVCSFPANAVPCTNYTTTYQGNGAACPNGAQDTPSPNSATAACQPTGDAQGNIGFWIYAGKYDFTVCVALNCAGPYTVTPGSGGGSGTITGITTAASSGLMGGGTSGVLNLQLLDTCGQGQVLSSDEVSGWICTTIGGTGTVTGTGTQYTLAQWANPGGTGIGDSMVQQNSAGSQLTVNGNISSPQSGVIAGALVFPGGTSLPNFATACNGGPCTNSIGFLGPNSTSFTSNIFRFPSTGPTNGQTFIIGTCTTDPNQAGVQECPITYGAGGGGGGNTFQIEGSAITSTNTINLNHSIPAAASGFLNVTFATTTSGSLSSVSASVPITGAGANLLSTNPSLQPISTQPWCPLPTGEAGACANPFIYNNYPGVLTTGISGTTVTSTPGVQGGFKFWGLPGNPSTGGTANSSWNFVGFGSGVNTAANFTVTFPYNTGTLAESNIDNLWSTGQTIAGNLTLSGASSGSVTVGASATGSVLDLNGTNATVDTSGNANVQNLTVHGTCAGCGGGGGGAGGNGASSSVGLGVTLTNGSTYYVPIYGSYASALTSTNAGQTLGAVQEIISNPQVTTSVAPSSGGSLVVTLYDVTAAAQVGTPGNVSCTVAAAAHTCQDTTNTYTVPCAAGVCDIMAWQVVPTTHAVSSTNLTIGSEIGTSANNGYVFDANCNGAVGTATTTTYTFGKFGSGAGSGAATGGCNVTIAASVAAPIPATCTAQKMYVNAGAAGANSGSGVVTLYHNGSASTLTCTLGTGLTCNDTTHTVSITAGDTYYIGVLTNATGDTTASLKVAFLCQ